MLMKDTEIISRAYLLNQITNTMMFSPSYVESNLKVSHAGIDICISANGQALYDNVISFQSIGYLDRMLLASKDIAKLISFERRGDK